MFLSILNFRVYKELGVDDREGNRIFHERLLRVGCGCVQDIARPEESRLWGSLSCIGVNSQSF